VAAAVVRFCGVSVDVLFLGRLFVEAGLKFKHGCEGQNDGDDKANADESGAGDGEVAGEVHLLTPIDEVSLGSMAEGSVSRAFFGCNTFVHLKYVSKDAD